MKATRHHFVSLDAFRGVTIAGMILVNHPGDWSAVYASLLHANWNGCTLADLVFPFFLFIVGVATTFAFARRREAGHETRQLYVRIVRRAALLVLLGIVLNAVDVAPAIGYVRLPGVLQRIGVVYLIVAFIVLNTRVRGRIVAIAVLVVAHWALLRFVPFGGYAAGTLLPDANLSSYIDRAVFGRHTLSALGDPEGLLATLPSVATALCGNVTGVWLRAETSSESRIVGLAVGGTLVALAGIAWSATLPLNKHLWTGSFVLYTGGLSALVLAACYAAIDAGGLERWSRPFVWLGVNPLAIYFASEFVGHLLERTVKWQIFWNGFVPLLGHAFSDELASLAMACCTVAVWTAIAGLLYRRGIRIQV